ncbi:hypothetical protein IAG25_35580 [Caballeronia sp. EK]|uniref:hypothetical protein n=1 Tax=Caballeronia sp. EK TaxID=2767469 RepID=UPI001655F8E8|nr:hypothetical protein [Caballeronia sp. EK]MBC8642129.1 hypothetical protein [Caballeronia sp. EK]
MTTQAELATRVLRKLKVLGTGQTADADDLLIAEEKVSAVHASLKKDERVRWTLQGIPEAAAEPYVFMASFLAAPEFGAGLTTDVWDWGEREISSLVSVPRSGEPVCAEYF